VHRQMMIQPVPLYRAKMESFRDASRFHYTLTKELLRLLVQSET
jgi:hypothetical protein